MEQYSRRFIEELEKHIDPTIIEFFENYCHHSKGKRYG